MSNLSNHAEESCEFLLLVTRKFSDCSIDIRRKFYPYSGVLL